MTGPPISSGLLGSAPWLPREQRRPTGSVTGLSGTSRRLLVPVTRSVALQGTRNNEGTAVALLRAVAFVFQNLETSSADRLFE